MNEDERNAHLARRRILGGPELYPLRFDGRGAPERFSHLDFVRIADSTYRNLAFLDDRMPYGSPCYSANVEALLALVRSEPAGQQAGAGLIFHTGYCCSTLLARYLQIPGTFLTLAEPMVLTQLAARRAQWDLRRPATAAHWSRLFQLAYRLLSRTYQPGEQALLKAHDSCTFLAGEALAAPGRVGLYLYCDLTTFLASALKSPERRAWVRQQSLACARPASGLSALAGIAVPGLSPGQAAAYLWLANVLGYLEAAADRRITLRSLLCDDLLEAPGPTVARVIRLFRPEVPAAQARRRVSLARGLRHAKGTQPFDPQARRQQFEESRRANREEIRAGLIFAERIARQTTLPWPLPRPVDEGQGPAAAAGAGHEHSGRGRDEGTASPSTVSAQATPSRIS
jgi:hypothetical protein